MDLYSIAGYLVIGALAVLTVMPFVYMYYTSYKDQTTAVDLKKSMDSLKMMSMVSLLISMIGLGAEAYRQWRSSSFRTTTYTRAT